MKIQFYIMFDFVIFSILSLFGIGLSIYLSHHQKAVRAGTKTKSFCDIYNRISCTKVSGSEYGLLFGIPIAYLGLFFFVAMLTLVFVTSSMGLPLRYLKGWSLLGVFFTIYLLYVEIFKIKAICPLCLISYLFDWAIVVLLFM